MDRACGFLNRRSRVRLTPGPPAFSIASKLSSFACSVSCCGGLRIVPLSPRCRRTVCRPLQSQHLAQSHPGPGKREKEGMLIWAYLLRASQKCFKLLTALWRHFKSLVVAWNELPELASGVYRNDLVCSPCPQSGRWTPATRGPPDRETQGDHRKASCFAASWSAA